MNTNRHDISRLLWWGENVTIASNPFQYFVGEIDSITSNPCQCFVGIGRHPDLDNLLIHQIVDETQISFESHKSSSARMPPAGGGCRDQPELLIGQTEGENFVLGGWPLTFRVVDEPVDGAFNTSRRIFSDGVRGSHRSGPPCSRSRPDGKDITIEVAAGLAEVADYFVIVSSWIQPES